MKKNEIIDLLRKRQLNELMDDLFEEAEELDCSIETLLDFKRYGWSEEHVATLLCVDFPNKYQMA